MKTTQLRIAFAWTCDDCGKDNFENGVVPDTDMFDKFEPPPELCKESMIGMFVCSPLEVTCKHCGSKFGAIEVEVDEEPGSETEL